MNCALSGYLKLIVYYTLISRVWANPVEAQSPNVDSTEESVCNICRELNDVNSADISDSLKEQFEDDKRDMTEALRDIEKHLNEITERIWWLPKSDVAKIFEDSQTVRDAVLKKTLNVQEIEAKTGAIRNKLEVYEAEKETNEAKAVEHWGILFGIRERLYSMEGKFRTMIGLASNLTTVMRLDKLRVSADTVAKQLKDVVDYYANNADILQTIHSNLHEIAVKKVELQAKTAAKKKKCAFLFFFCD